MSMMGDVTTGVLAEPETKAVTKPVHPVRDAKRTPARWRPSSSVLRIRAIIYLLLLDCTVIAGSFIAVAAGLRQGVVVFDGWLSTIVLLVPIYLLIAFNTHVYAPVVLQNPFLAIRRGAKALIAALCALLVLAFYLRSSTQLSRTEFAAASTASLMLLAIGRYLFVCHLSTIVGGNPFSSILITDGNQSVPRGGRVFRPGGT